MEEKFKKISMVNEAEEEKARIHRFCSRFVEWFRTLGPKKQKCILEERLNLKNIESLYRMESLNVLGKLIHIQWEFDY